MAKGLSRFHSRGECFGRKPRHLRDPEYGRSRKHFYSALCSRSPYWNRSPNRQVKLSSDVGTTAKPQSPRLPSQGGSLLACSTRLDQKLDHFKEGSDQHLTTPDSEFHIQEKLSSDIVTTATHHSPSRLSLAKQLGSSSKKLGSSSKKLGSSSKKLGSSSMKRVLHKRKRKVSQNNKTKRTKD